MSANEVCCDTYVNVYIDRYSPTVGQKRKRSEEDGSIAELLHTFEKAEENAAKREARYRERELELEAQAREREDRREERMMILLNAMLQQCNQQFQPPFQHPYPPSQQPSFPSQSIPQFQPYSTLEHPIPYGRSSPSYTRSDSKSPSIE